MSIFRFKLADIGEGITESEIALWRVSVGEVISEDQPLVDMLTDKAAVELPSPVSGRVLRLHGAVGDKIAVGGVLAEIETEAGAEAATPVVAEPRRSDFSPIAAPAASRTEVRPALQQQALANPDPAASPSVRRQAREQGIDLSSVSGSGPRGRITQADFDTHLATRTSPAPSSSVAPTQNVEDRVEQIRIVGLRRKIAEAMQRSSQRIPHFSYVEETDVTELEELRAHLNASRGADQPKLTVLPFLIRALVRALPQFPQINATYDDEAGIVHRHSAVHLGIATQTPNGLIVPVIRHAERLDLWQLAAEIKRLANAVRENKAKREELSGSTITVTSLGTLGGIASTPIINAPEVAIIGVNRIVERPMIRRGQVAPRLMMNLSSSFDHRIVDGWDAAAAIQSVRTTIEHPATIFIGSA